MASRAHDVFLNALGIVEKVVEKWSDYIAQRDGPSSGYTDGCVSLVEHATNGTSLPSQSPMPAQEGCVMTIKSYRLG